MIKAITFDMWDTLVIDDSDEPVRRARGLAPKPAARAQLVHESFSAAWPTLTPARIDAAWTESLARFRHAWKVEHRTPWVPWRVDQALQVLDRPRHTGFDALVQQLEAMERDIPPDPLPGAVECLEALSQRYRLGITSDAIMTPGRYLRDVLETHGLLRFFDHIVYSDEAGAAKPDPRVFRLACAGLGCAPEELVHIGDREPNDIEGPNRFGARAVLFTGAIDRGSGRTQAAAICDHLALLPAVIAKLDTP